MELVENTVVANRFRLNRLLGRGGMGSVWHATHLGLDIPCAVKFIEGEFATLPEAHVRFEREAKAAAQLRSPNVVQILDHGVWEERPYIAMELLEGEDLGKRIERVGRLQPGDVARILREVCRALSRAHPLGIVHRDLKPDNIFLVRDDDREIAKVLDFGIAKSNTSALEGSNTRTGAMLGTPYYMSPEQAQGTKAVDHRSDLWSLAVIAFQCLTGRLPFESDALGDLLVKIIVSPLPTPSHFGPVPPGFDTWWARAASRNPDERFPSAKEFAESLQLALGLSDPSISGNASNPNLGQAPFGVAAPGGNASQSGDWPAQPGVPVAPGSSPAMQQTGGAPQAAVPVGAHATTGAPVAHTYGGFGDQPKRGSGALVAIVGAAGVLLAGVVGAGVYFMRGHSPGDDAASASSDQVAAPPDKPVAPPKPVARKAVPTAKPKPPKATEPDMEPPKPTAAAKNPSGSTAQHAEKQPATTAKKPVVPSTKKPPAKKPPTTKPGGQGTYDDSLGI